MTILCKLRNDVKNLAMLGLVLVLVISPFGSGASGDEKVPREKSPQPTLLADACELNQWMAVKKLLTDGSDANEKQVDGMTPLLWATYADHAQTVEILIKAGADASATNRYGVMALSLACCNGNATIVKMLLDAGADANAELPGGESVLLTAARTGQPAAVELLLDRGAKVNHQERKGQTATMWAAAEGNVNVLKLLLDAGADFQNALDSGFTPLMFAVREGELEATECLLSRGVDVNSVMTPRRDGAKSPRKGISPLLLAVENGHFDLAVKLLEAGADPNDQRSGFTALHTLTWVRKPNRGDSADGDPAPIGSGRLDSLQFARKLVQLGADVNLRLKQGSSGRGKLNHRGATALMFAAKTGDMPLLKLLLQLGADPAIPNADHCTPLLAAAGIGTLAPGEEAGTEDEAIEAVKLLISLGGNVNHTDDNGETAMHGAAYKSLPKVVRLLAAHGADIQVWNTKNKHGWTPILIAEGHRPGNFKPSVETLSALHDEMKARGITPPKRTPRENRKGYDQK